MICPHCGSTDTRASRSTRWRDAFPRTLGREPYRCRGCRKRFYASPFAQSAAKQGTPARGSKRSTHRMRSKTRKRIKSMLVLFGTFGLAFGLFWIFLRYFTAVKAPS